MGPKKRVVKKSKDNEQSFLKSKSSSKKSR